MVSVCVELEVILVLTPCFFGGGIEEFFLGEFNLAVCVVVAVGVCVEVFLFGFV